jgi:hypothetical protein
MFKQPSVNQIASAYQGNPAPLAQKVQQDKQQNGGIPQDLRQLLALNDITQGRNAVASQQALQAPAQMPTVAQSLQERARQAIQAQLMQQMQQQQAKEGQLGMVPPNTPRPPMQAQGIDNLPTNVGEQYARGGIIGFDGTGTSQFVQDIAKIPQAFDDMKERAREEDRIKQEQDKRMEQYRQDRLAAQQKTSFFNYLFGSPEREKEGQTKLTELSNAQPSNSAPAVERGRPTMINDPRLDANYNTTPTGPGAPKPATEINTASVAKPVSQRVNATTTDSAPMPGGLADLASLQSTGVGNKYLQDQLAKNQKFDPEEFKQKYLKEVGRKDLSIYDQTAEELKARKERLNAPKEGYDSLMEYLGQIAQGGGGRNWMEAGAKGAAGVNALRKQRQSEQDVLMDKILDLGAKKKEAEYGERLGMFNLTKAEQDKITKESTEVAGKLGLSEDKQRELAQNMAIEKMREKVEYDRMANQVKVANIGAQDRDQLMNRAKALMAVDKTLTLEEAMKRAALAAGAASLESVDARQNKDYIAAKNKIDERFQYLISDTPYGKQQKTLYDTAIADLNRTYGVSGGINTLSSAAKPIPAGAGPNDLSVGTVYQTARGPAKWNGKAFDPVQ